MNAILVQLTNHFNDIIRNTHLKKKKNKNKKGPVDGREGGGEVQEDGSKVGGSKSGHHLPAGINIKDNISQLPPFKAAMLVRNTRAHSDLGQRYVDSSSNDFALSVANSEGPRIL